MQKINLPNSINLTIYQNRLERLRSLANEEMKRSPSVNGAPFATSPPIAPDLQRVLRSPPQHLLNADRANSTTPANDDGTVIPRPKSPSECWLQAFKTGKIQMPVNIKSN